MSESKRPGALQLVFSCLSLLLVGIGSEIVNYLGAEGAGYFVLWFVFAGLALWAAAEAFLPAIAEAARRWIYLAAAPLTILLSFTEWPVYYPVVAVFGLVVGAIFSATLCRLVSAFDGKYRYTKLSAVLGCFFCGIGLYLLASDPVINFVYDRAVEGGMDEEAAYYRAFEQGAIIIHAVLAALFLLLFFLYRKPKKLERDQAADRVFTGLPVSRGLLVSIGLGIVVLSALLSTLNKAYLNVTDRNDEFLYYMFIVARLWRLPLVTLYGLLIDRKLWRALISVPLVLILLCGSIPLLFAGQVASTLVFFLATMGGSSFTYLIILLPMMIAPRFKTPSLLACTGAFIYMLLTVTLDVSIVKYGVGPFLFANKEVLFVVVVLSCVPMFFLLTEYFIRQRGMELGERFARGVASGRLEPAPVEKSVKPVHATGPALRPVGAADLATLADTYMLTRRERELLPYLLSPLTAEEIAKETFVSVSTARTHIGNILGKMRMPSRRALQKAVSQEGEPVTQ